MKYFYHVHNTKHNKYHVAWIKGQCVFLDEPIFISTADKHSCYPSIAFTKMQFNGPDKKESRNSSCH